MKTTIVQIGNSRGVRIPKAFLDQAGLKNEVEMQVRGSQIVLRTPRDPREGWAEAFDRMAQSGDDALLDETPETSWDKTEWEW